MVSSMNMIFEIIKFQYIVKYGATRMEVDIDGSFSYAEPQNDVKDNGNSLILEQAHLCNFV